MSLDRETRAFAARLVRLYKQITHADLTAAVNGAEQDILLGTLPTGGGFLLGRAVRINTFFTGGAATAVTMALGTGAAGDPDSIMAALNVFDTTTEDIWLPGTSGVSPSGPYGGSSVYAQFDCDAGHALLGLTAGDIEVELIFAMHPDNNLGI
jgi:hypothetical protein